MTVEELIKLLETVEDKSRIIVTKMRHCDHTERPHYAHCVGINESDFIAKVDDGIIMQQPILIIERDNINFC